VHPGVLIDELRPLPFASPLTSLLLLPLTLFGGLNVVHTMSCVTENAKRSGGKKWMLIGHHHPNCGSA